MESLLIKNSLHRSRPESAGLSLEQVKLYARQYEDAERMKQIRLALEEGCCNEFQLEFYTSKQIEAFRINIKQVE